MVGLVAILITITCKSQKLSDKFLAVELSLKFKQTSEYKEGVLNIHEAFQRHDLMADINFKTRKLEVLSRNLITGLSTAEKDALETDIKTKVSTLKTIILTEQLNTQIKSLQNIQFDVIKAAIKVDSEAETKTYPIETLLNTGVSIEESLYNDAIFQVGSLQGD